MLRTLPIVLLLWLSFAPVAAAQSAAPSEEPCDCETQRPATLAVVNGVEIPASAVDADAAPYVEPIKQQMAALREQSLQSLITNRLVELEAQKQNVSYARFIQTAVVSKVEEPTEAEVRAFYDRNRASFDGKSFEEMKESLANYIRSQRQQVEMTILTTDLRSAAKIEVLDYSPSAPATSADRAKVLAVVNGSKITLGELEDSLRTPLFRLRQQVWAIERDALDNRIDDILIEQEAKRRNMTPQALVDGEIRPKAKKVDAFDASKFYNENKAQFGGRPFAEVKDDLVKLLALREIMDAKTVYAGNLRKSATIKVSLPEPTAPSFEIRTDGRPTLGEATAPVTVVVFSDFQCPKCAEFHTTVDALAKQYNGKVRIVARNYPLDQHPLAYRAAVASEVAFEQGKYWEFSDLVFANQKSLSPEKLKEIASQVGIDRSKFDAALDEQRYMDVVDVDIADGNRAGILGTPSAYVNGRQLDDLSPEGLKAAIDEALRRGA